MYISENIYKIIACLGPSSERTQYYAVNKAVNHVILKSYPLHNIRVRDANLTLS